MSKNCPSCNVDKIINRISIVYEHIKEQGFEPFEQLALDKPEGAIKKFPEFLNSVLGAGNNLFSGQMCGGPYPPATAPLLNSIGAIYTHINSDLQRQALERCLNFLDRLNYFNSQENVELIDEPWLIRDILINRSLYWCGFKFYIKKLNNIATWQDFEREFFTEKDDKIYINAQSAGWLAYSLSRVDLGYNLPSVRQIFTELFPDVIDRTKDFAAALAVDHAKHEEVSEGKNYREGLCNRLRKHYPADWQEDLERKVEDKKWIWLPERLKDLKI